jgi:hypothetical protein
MRFAKREMEQVHVPVWRTILAIPTRDADPNAFIIQTVPPTKRVQGTDVLILAPERADKMRTAKL